ncbi:hypothetical protein [Desulforhabdus amnigena]|jgi:hypothetical protein|uniref:Uncharacterized protein n=1 Tax=Desulforhabdus amnigena TaxID=40218 RepID=A0A9W6D1Z7_9BACT|nr:hypothetical protein [Desulforhabdus amnigena]NLJ28706.1 hypothetical protein [Deltaproteobacteria bacterium]GLI33793.1 hypothetical protein DAMNIGENAA_12260 [Desulforhabdus amnigena]
MVFHAPILGLLMGSFGVGLMLLYSAFHAVRIVRNWDIQSGSELQLNLERRTYLISSLISHSFAFQLFSFFLFIYTVDRLAPLFVGAMCAAGSLNVNRWGYPTIILKIFNFILAGLWLVLNFTDNRAYDYPLIRKKYALLLFITPFIVAETILQAAYFFGLQPNIITSCCGTLFTSDAEGVVSGIIALPPLAVETVYYLCMAITIGLGIHFYKRGKGAYTFSFVAFLNFLAGIASLISFIGLYFYELPTHHCPFCLLQKEYLYVGYPLYIAFLAGGVSGLAVGVIGPFSTIETLKGVVPSLQRRLTLVSLLSYSVSLLIVIYGVMTSNLTLRE